MTAAEWLEAVEAEERRGELLAAVDLAERGLEAYPDDIRLRHRAVLALARSGSTHSADKRYREYGLDGVKDEDVQALGARIAKDEALAAPGEERGALAARAANAYASIYSDTGGYYPAINSATLSLLSGDRERSLALAREVLELPALEGGSYYAHASRAEARLLLGDAARARDELSLAADAAGDDHGALATTRRQLRLICGELGIDESVLEPLSGPAVVHYCGHRIAGPGEAGRFPAEAETPVADAIAGVVKERGPGYAYGSLAAGADILWAEALLEAGCELHVVLPFVQEEFIRCSVAPSGEAWADRFRACLSAAREITYAVEDAYLDDDVLYRYGAELAMGLVLLRGRYLDASVLQLAVWDGGEAAGDAGTAIDVATWSRGGRVTEVVPPHAGGKPALGAGSPSRRVVRAMLFGDVKGFSTLTDEEIPRFAEGVLGSFGSVLERYSGQIEHKNTWGDALYVVLSDASVAADCALELQEAMASIDLQASGLPDHLALRMGGHLGPGFPTWDPVIGETAFMGSHVSRTARIEPVTPPGSVYVTSEFAAALALAGRDDLACDYVGHMPAAKDFGKMRMYRLFQRAGWRR